jgi:hypothetical protein
MDKDSFALLADVFARSRAARTVFLFAGRAGFTHPLDQTEGHVTVDLGELPPPEAERLTAARLGVDAVPAPLLHFVADRAGGHPLFVEEVLKALVEARAVTVAERRVVSMKLDGAGTAVPKTLRGLVASRLARLSSEDRGLLQAAAVLGPPVDLGLLSSMVDQPIAALERSLVELARREVVVRGGPTELRFASPLVPEVVVDGLAPDAARQLHAAAARALEEAMGDRAGEQAARIALHWEEAGDRERAADYYAESGSRRLSKQQPEAAARDYARAVSLADATARPAEQLVLWLEHLAAAVRLVRPSPDLRELCDRVVDSIDRAGDEESRLRARVAAAGILGAAHEIARGRARLAEAESLAAPHSAFARPVRVGEAELAVRQGDFVRALLLLGDLPQPARAPGDAEEAHRIALCLAQSRAAVGDRSAALAALQSVDGLLPDAAAAALERKRVGSLVDYFTRDFRAAALRSEEAAQLGREHGLPHEAMLNLHQLGLALVRLGDRRRAFGAFEQSLALCEESGDERFAGCNRMFLSFLDAIDEGAPPSDDGERPLRRAIAYAEAREFTSDVVAGRLLLSKLLQRLGRLGEARDEFEKTRAIALGAGHRLVADDCRSALEALDSSR